MHSKLEISVVILTKNSQQYLERVLSALGSFKEVLIIDNGSTDNTIEIAKKFNNTKIIYEEFIGFGALKNKALTYTKYDWVFVVDSDEVISHELVKEIASLELKNKNIYTIKRDNYYKNKLIKCCGWGNDFVMRLFNKKITQFNNNKVHESLLIKNKNLNIVKLDNVMKHYSFDNPIELINKMNHYSTLYAQEHKHRKNSSPIIAVSKAIFAFFKNYILQRGILCGYEGVLISISNANGVFYKYIKLYEENKS